MKRYTRSLVVSFLAFLVVAYYYPGFNYGGSMMTLIIAASVFSVLTIFVKPIINLLSLPFNLLTFGLFSFITNLIILYAVTYLVEGFKIIGFSFPGYSYSGFVIPAVDLTQLLSALVASVIIGFISTALFWIFR